MSNNKRLLSVASLGVLLAASTATAAQDNASIGNPQLRDFQIQPRERIVTQPAPQQQPEAPRVRVAPPSPATQAPSAQPRGERPRPAQTQAPARQQPAAETRQPAPPSEAAPGPAPVVPDPSSVAPTPIGPAPAPDAPSEQPGGFPWLYLAGGIGLLALIAFLAARRRRRAEEQREDLPAVEDAPPPEPATGPVDRPWLEVSLKAERASHTLDETLVLFELEIANTGRGAARDLRVDVKMFNAGQEQDKEMNLFFRTAGRDSTKCHLPGIDAEMTGVLKGEVAMKRDDMRAVQLREKLLFIPVIAVNVLYDWGDGRTGQTSRSWVVGRELETPSEKMGAFRVDQGPRVWRTVGQRQNKLARRV